jgi:carbamoyl-phosphate synthase large subunit
MSRLRIGLSGINATDNPGPGVAVARSLKKDRELDAEIIGLAYDALEPGLYMDWVVDHAFILPYPSGEGSSYLERLTYIRDRCGLDVVIPNFDAELPFYLKHAGDLERSGIRTFLPTMAQFRLRGKDRLCEVAERTGIKLPETRILHSPEQFQEAIRKLRPPVMVKGVFYKAYRADSTAHAEQHFQTLVAEWGYPVILQEVVEGDELNVVGLGDGEGGALGLVGIKKLGVSALGKIWTGVTIRHPGMLAAAERFVQEYRWRGPFELECIVSEGDVHLIEINPRFPAWSWFATAVGVNLPARMVRHLLGREMPPPVDYPAGKLFVRYSYELVTDMNNFQKAITRGELP